MATIHIERQVYQLDAILFDKDGTLLNLDHLWTGWLAAVLDCLAADLAPQVELARGAVHTALGVTMAEAGADRNRGWLVSVGVLVNLSFCTCLFH